MGKIEIEKGYIEKEGVKYSSKKYIVKIKNKSFFKKGVKKGKKVKIFFSREIFHMLISQWKNNVAFSVAQIFRVVLVETFP